MFVTREPSGGVSQVGQGQFSVLVSIVCPNIVIATPLEDRHLRPLALGARQIVETAVEVPSAPPVHVVALQAVSGP
jgi:hypothetical protein